MELKKYKVCHVTSVHSWNDIRIFQKQCVSLAKSHFDVFLVAGGGVSGVFDNVNIVNVELQKQGRFYRFFSFRKKIITKALEIDADIYHFHDPELLPYGKMLLKKGKKIIFDSHEDVPNDILDKDWIRPNILKVIISKIYNFYEKRITKKYSGVISVLESITSKFNHPNSITIHNYPILSNSNFEKDSVTILPDKYRIVYNGGLSRIRGIHVLIESLSFLNNDFVLVLMGSWETLEYENKCKQIKGWEKVLYLGNLTLEECHSILGDCDLGVVLFENIPNHANSLPNKAFEFIAAKIPMLMSSFDFWIKEFGSYAHFVNEKMPNQIANKIKEIKMNDTNEKEKASKSLILKDKSWEDESKKLVMFYEQIFKL